MCRRLVDAAKLFNASRGIAQKHIALRTNQWDAYNKTSSLAKAVKNQTDRITLTAAAAIALSQRFSEEAPAYAKAAAERATTTQWTQQDNIPRRETIEKEGPTQGVREGVEQDHHYDRSGQNTTEAPPPTDELEIEQEKAPRSPLPDGTIPTQGLTLEQEEKRQDTFSERPAHEAPKEPLVRDKSGHVRHEDEGIKPVESSESTIPLPGQPRGGYAQTTGAVPAHSKEEHELPDGINTDVFHSKRVARMLGSDPLSRKEHVQRTTSGRHPLDDRPLPSSVRASQASTPPKSAQESKPAAVSEEMEKFASQLAQDAQSNIATSQPRDEVVTEQEKAPYALRESRVPSSRFGRMWQYAGLGTSMALGAVGEGLRRATGSAASTTGSLMLSPGNLEILVAKLSRMRGAALKLGQMISFQDIKMLPPAIHDVLQRVQDSADYMPASQRNKVLSSNLGDNWRDLFESFEDVPIAAASIGQVHKAVLKSTGQAVAVKVQYPGVANSIDSDLSNLSILLTASRLLPKGLFLDKTIANARTELGWECDYTREAECQTRFRDLLQDDTDVFTVPKVFPEACGPTVLTAELMHGVGVTKLKTLSQEQRDWIGTQILRLCLREIVEFKFMQTDPNWTNFLYNASAQKIELLDFGASRDYPDQFVEPYIKVLIAASKGDKPALRDLSLELGYLTGNESPAMLEAHIQSVLTLAEPFSGTGPEIYDFRDQTITDRVRGLIPVMMKERLAPPPEETYSLHRKLSGAFLLCAKLGSRVPCRDLFSKAVKTWEGKAKMK
ncbi:Atypical ABC1 ABC1-A kinase [Pyrenophora seminiperda CCB06]|uniref:Atypical ABC1 ABC1-A kinase n=1 Tax=Pyrenophora seminiperda CCB06 TaxID=1302712 RepID=A0A3M7MFW4_9PLEO|nr:Atypical ABC1 ABC1-A kinase [Pyrenophora seminiperda CCB06]